MNASPANPSSPLSPSGLGNDLISGVTVALIAIPQCMAFAVIAGLQPAAGLNTAILMTLVAAAFSNCPKLVLGPTATTSTLIYATLVSAAPQQPLNWPALAAEMAILVGLLTGLAAMLGVGQFVRFVSRPVLDGFFAGAAALIIASQLAPALGLAGASAPTLAGQIWALSGQLGQISPHAALLAAATLVVVMLGERFAPRWPAPFLALIAAGFAARQLEQHGVPFATIASIPRELPTLYQGSLPLGDDADFLIGVLALTLVCVVQTLALAKKLVERPAAALDARRELVTLGVANVASGLFGGFIGAGSFARSAINARGRAGSRLAGFLAAAATAALVWMAAPWAGHVPKAAIAAILIATAIGATPWREMAQVVARDRRDRIVLIATLLAALLAPIHWAILIGLALSIAIFIRRVSRLHIFEMVRDESDHYHERLIDARTGEATITLLQIQGPLFFAHADELTETLRRVLARAPRVLIIRMRRTQQMDYSVLVALAEVLREFEDSGGRVILCGLTLRMRRAVLGSPLGEVIPRRRLRLVTRQIFGSARGAIEIAQRIVQRDPIPGRPLFRLVAAPRSAGSAEPARRETGDVAAR